MDVLTGKMPACPPACRHPSLPGCRPLPPSASPTTRCCGAPSALPGWRAAPWCGSWRSAGRRWGHGVVMVVLALGRGQRGDHVALDRRGHVEERRAQVG